MVAGGRGEGRGGSYEDGGLAVWDLRWTGRAVGGGKVHEEPGEDWRLWAGPMNVPNHVFRCLGFVFFFGYGELRDLWFNFGVFVFPLFLFIYFGFFPICFLVWDGEGGGAVLWLKPVCAHAKERKTLSSLRLILFCFPFSVMSVAMDRCGGGGLSGSADDKIAFFRVEDSTVRAQGGLDHRTGIKDG